MNLFLSGIHHTAFNAAGYSNHTQPKLQVNNTRCENNCYVQDNIPLVELAHTS